MAKTYANFNNLINFTRSTSGTALRRVSYGTELVTNGTFDSDTTGWTASVSSLSIESGALKITSDGVAGNKSAYQVISGLSVGNVYEISVDVIAKTGSVIQEVRVGTAINGINQLYEYIYETDSTNIFRFVAGATSQYISILFYDNTGDVTKSSTFDNVSVKEVLFDQPNAPLTLFNHPAGIPRIEYDADGNRLGLLVEQAKTNLVTYSEDFSNAAWSGYWQKPTFVTGQLAPDGSYTAMKWNASTTTGSSSGAYGGLVFGQGQATAGVTYTASVWLKASASVNMSLGLTDGATTIITLTNEWVRYSYTGESVGTLRLFQLNENTNEDIDIYIWGAQTEVGSFPTSYIPTSGSTATRAADVASIPVSAFGYNKSEGTLVVEASIERVSGVAGTSIFNFTQNSDSTANATRLFYRAGGNTGVFNSVGGVTDVDFTPSGILSAGQAVTTAVVYKENDYAACADGGSVSTDTSNTIPSHQLIQIGAGQAYLNGHIKSIQYYPRRLTNTQLQELTS